MSGHRVPNDFAASAGAFSTPVAGQVEDHVENKAVPYCQNHKGPILEAKWTDKLCPRCDHALFWKRKASHRGVMSNPVTKDKKLVKK